MSMIELGQMKRSNVSGDPEDVQPVECHDNRRNGETEDRASRDDVSKLRKPHTI